MSCTVRNLSGMNIKVGKIEFQPGMSKTVTDEKVIASILKLRKLFMITDMK